MTTLAIGRPFRPAAAWWQRINWIWWLQRAPMVLLAVPAAYGVYAFSLEHLPPFFAATLGIAFEATYIGAVATADQQLDNKDRLSTTLWWFVNVGAVVASVVFNLLFVAGGRFANIEPESYAHALPMPILAFFYGLMLHRNAVQMKAAETNKVLAETQIGHEERAAQAAHEKANPYICEFCGARKPSVRALNGHKAQCRSRSS